MGDRAVEEADHEQPDHASREARPSRFLGACSMPSFGLKKEAAPAQGRATCCRACSPALIAQQLTPQSPLLLAVYLHGAAADDLVEQCIGPIGMTATEVTDAARKLLNRWVYGR